MMKKGVLVVLVLLFLPFVFASGTDELKATLNGAVFYAEKYHSGNLDYVSFSTYLAQAEDDLNYILSSRDYEFSEEELIEVFGEPTKRSFWIEKEHGGEIQMEEKVAYWENLVEFNGRIHLKLDLLPLVDEKGLIYYRAEFAFSFKDDKPELNLEEEVLKVQSLVKEVVLDPDIKKINDLADLTVTIEDLFLEYSEQTPDSCEAIMDEILGSGSLEREQEIVTKEFLVGENDDVKVIAMMSLCENCEGYTRNFIDLDMKMKRNGESVEYSIEGGSGIEDYSSFGEAGFKQEMIKLNRALNQLFSAGNYKPSYVVMYEMEKVNDAWDDFADSGTEEERIRNYVERVRFMHELFESYPLLESSYTRQVYYKKILYQELGNESGEICDNGIDDNGNNETDCEEEFCAGQLCDVRIENYTEGNETFQKSVKYFCVAGECVAEEEEKLEEAVCGNKICEEGEAIACSSDCVSCPEHPPIECDGVVVFKGEDANGCALEPVCLEDNKECSVDEDCVKPRCGGAQCILGECKLVGLDSCSERVCLEGDEKVEECSSGFKVVTGVCVNGVWKDTGEKCEVAVSESLGSEKDGGDSCVVADDCKEGYVCSKGDCIVLAEKKSVTQPTATKEGKKVSGISFTGQAVTITGDIGSITGVSRGEGDSEEELEQYILAREKEEGATSVSRLTGILDPTAQEEVVVAETQELNEYVESLAEGETSVFAVRGVCIETPEGTDSHLYFTSGGERFSDVTNLQERYDFEGAKGSCSWDLNSLVEERAEIVESLNEEFAEWYFEEYIPNNADSWESAKKILVDIHERNIQNQIDTAYAMDCLGMSKLAEYKLIDFKYETDSGVLIYDEEFEVKRFPGMTNDVQIVTPYMEFLFYPSKEFVKMEMQNAMNGREFLGPVDEVAMRRRGEGLTGTERTMIEDDRDLMNKIGELASEKADGSFDVRVSVVEGEEIVYNVFARVNEDMKGEVMPLEKTPKVDSEIEIDFDKLFDLVYSSQERQYKHYAPWKKNEVRINEVVSSTLDWISLRLQVADFMNSVEIFPANNNAREVFEDVFLIVAEEEDESDVQVKVSRKEPKIVWSSEGEKQVIAVSR